MHNLIFSLSPSTIDPTTPFSGLWLLLAIVQGYLLFVVRLYGREQKADHGVCLDRSF